MERVEAKFGLNATAGFAERVEAVHAAITEHDRRHGQFQRDLEAKEDTATKLKTATIKRDGLRGEKETWDRSWPGAMRALGGSATISPSRRQQACD